MAVGDIAAPKPLDLDRRSRQVCCRFIYIFFAGATVRRGSDFAASLPEWSAMSLIRTLDDLKRVLSSGHCQER